jgi:hypothetical protein
MKNVEDSQDGIKSSIDAVKVQQASADKKQARWSGAIAVLVVLIPILLKLYDVVSRGSVN